MKTILIAISALLCLTNAWAGQRIDAAAWKNVQTYDVGTLLSQEASLIGRIVAVRFHYRSDKLRHLEPNWYEASIWQHDPKAKGGYSAQRVMVAKKDVPAFQTIPSDFHSMTNLTAYGRVEKDPDNNQTHLRLLGRKVETDAAGNATVDW
ncbi:MAG TPA: hypothetical protein VH188_05695 [Chthoniobacterales bacterium]|jgi:hypothetical protein|nr:hypothetical protein [Chthoniobacterales bacterium]